MLRKRLSLFIVVAMLLSMFVPTAYASDIPDIYQGSDRAYDVQDITYEIEEYSNPFGALQAHDDVERELRVSSSSEFTVQRALLPEVDKTTASAMYAHLYHLSETIGTRRANTDKEIEAKDYIVQVFSDAGYSPVVQPFTYQSSRNSNNVIATREGKSAKQIIVGAHYDSVNTKGASDNASGTAVMLTTAEMLKDVQTDYTIKFVAFGAEEVGLQGSNYYASQMSEEDIANTIAMINLDTVLVGDYMYAYGNLGEAGWVREQALFLAKTLGLEVVTQRGLHPDYPAGTTGDWSDHAPFKRLGLPWLYFESTNWEIGEFDGYEETESHGSIMHTSKDNLAFMHENFPGRVEDRLYTYTTLLSNLLVNITPPATSEGKIGINVSTNLLSMSEAREVEVAVNLGYVPELKNLQWTLGNKPFTDWKSFASGSYTGSPFITFTVAPYLDGDTVRATIKCDLPYGTSNLQGRPYPRTAYPALLGEYNLAVSDITTNATAKTVMKLNAYDSYHTYDQIKPEVERIISIAKKDRYLEYEAMGYSSEGREIPFVMFARSKADLNKYLNETLPMMLEEPALFIDKINKGEAGTYKPAIWFNNIHSDEANGVDAQLDLLRRLATEDTITFKRAVNNQDKSELETVTLDVQEVLDNFIILFNLNNNPDGRYYNRRETLAGFDPNRDVSYQTQIEMVNVMEGIGKWSPMILNDFHGYVSAFLIEPCTPPHDPNFEYDLLMDGMIDHAHAMGKAGIANSKYNNYIIPLFDYEDGWDDGGPMYTPVAAMLHGTMGHTLEIPELNQESNDAFMYAGFGSILHALENKERLFKNQLEIYRRGV
ncbi:M28 family peptidase [Sedimentibacter sp.]|nr:M28 family peptidase [Sedimentibacter sp.]